MEFRIFIFILFYISRVQLRPSKQLDSSTELAWEAWLLIHGDRFNVGDETLRKITPKSIFTVRPFSPELLPPCADGYKSDAMGRCIKFIKIEQHSHLGYLVEKLNSMYSVHDEDDYPDDEEENNDTVGGPLQFNIPIEQEKDINPHQKNETNIAVIVASLNENIEAAHLNVTAGMNIMHNISATEHNITNITNLLNGSLDFIPLLEEDVKNITQYDKDINDQHSNLFLNTTSSDTTTSDINYLLSDDNDVSNMSLITNSSLTFLNENITMNIPNTSNTILSSENETLVDKSTPSNTNLPNSHKISGNMSTVLKIEVLNKTTDKLNLLNGTKDNETHTLFFLIPITNSSNENLNTSQREIIDFLKAGLPQNETKNIKQNQTSSLEIKIETTANTNLEGTENIHSKQTLIDKESILANNMRENENTHGIQNDTVSANNPLKHIVDTLQINDKLNKTFEIDATKSNNFFIDSGMENSPFTIDLKLYPHNKTNPTELNVKNNTFEMIMKDEINVKPVLNNKTVTEVIEGLELKLVENTTVHDLIRKNISADIVSDKVINSTVFDKITLSEIIEPITENNRIFFNNQNAFKDDQENHFKIHHSVSLPNNRHTFHSLSTYMPQNTDNQQNTHIIKFPEHNHRSRDKHISWWLQPDSRVDSTPYRTSAYRSQYFNPRRPFAPSISYSPKQSSPHLYRDSISQDARRFYGNHRWNNR